MGNCMQNRFEGLQKPSFSMLRPRLLRDNSQKVLSRCVLLKVGGGLGSRCRFQIQVQVLEFGAYRQQYSNKSNLHGVSEAVCSFFQQRGDGTRTGSSNSSHTVCPFLLKHCRSMCSLQHSHWHPLGIIIKLQISGLLPNMLLKILEIMPRTFIF